MSVDLLGTVIGLLQMIGLSEDVASVLGLGVTLLASDSSSSVTGWRSEVVAPPEMHPGSSEFLTSGLAESCLLEMPRLSEDVTSVPGLGATLLASDSSSSVTGWGSVV